MKRSLGSMAPARPFDSLLAPAAVFVLGAGLLVAASGALGRSDALAISAALAAAAALVLLMAGGWLDPLVALALTLPLPALYAAGDVRLAPAAPMTVAVLTAWVIAWGPTGARARIEPLPVSATLALVFTYAFAGLLSDYRAAAARELANLLLLIGLLFVVTDWTAREPRRSHRLAAAIAYVAGVTGLLAGLETAGVLPGAFPEPNGLNRAALGFGQPNGLGMFLALSLPFAWHVRRTSHRRSGRVLGTLALAGTVAGLAATFSRGSWLSVLAGAAVLALAGRWRFVLRIWAAAVAAAVVADLASGGAIRTTVFGAMQDWSVAQRAALMWAGVQMFLRDPVVGVGPGGFAHELERVGALVPTLWDLKPTPHNAYIQFAAETGILGLAAFVAFLSAIFRRARAAARAHDADPLERSLRQAVFWAFGIVCAEAMVEWPLSHGHGQLVMIIVALACAKSLRAPPARAMADVSAARERVA